MKSLRNSVQLIGRLGKDPEVKTFGDKKKSRLLNRYLGFVQKSERRKSGRHAMA